MDSLRDKAAYVVRREKGPLSPAQPLPLGPWPPRLHPPPREPHDRNSPSLLDFKRST